VWCLGRPFVLLTRSPLLRGEQHSDDALQQTVIF